MGERAPTYTGFSQAVASQVALRYASVHRPPSPGFVPLLRRDEMAVDEFLNIVTHGDQRLDNHYRKEDFVAVRAG